MAGVRVAKVRDLPEGHGRTVIVAGRPVALFNVGGTFHAVDDLCLHRGGSLGSGSLEGPIVSCPNHGWEYDVRSGQNLGNPSMRVRSYAVDVDGDDVLIHP